MLMIINTVARTVEYDNIHLYRQRRYVKRPEINAKKEYHRRVSPIVHIGGLSKLIHKPMMNAARTATAALLNMMARPRRRLYLNEDTDQWSLAQSAITAPAADKTAEVIPNHMNESQVIIASTINLV